jgi:zinc protease
MPGADQAAVVVTAPMPPLGRDRAAGAMLNEVLGGGYSSRLNQEIRIQRGLSYSAGSQLDARRAAATLRVVVQTKNPSAADVVALVQAELDRLVAAPVGEAEFAARKAALIGEFSRGVETTAGLGAAVATLVVAGLPPDELRRRIAALEAVTPADVQRLAAAHLAPTQRRVVVAGAAASFAEALKAASPAAVTVPAQVLELERSDGLAAP